MLVVWRRNLVILSVMGLPVENKDEGLSLWSYRKRWNRISRVAGEKGERKQVWLRASLCLALSLRVL